MLDGFWKMEANPLLAGGIVKMQSTPLHEILNSCGNSGAILLFLVHEARCGKRSGKLNIRASPAEPRNPLFKRGTGGRILRNRDLLQGGQNPAPNKVDLETKHRILIRRGSGKSFCVCLNLKQTRQETADTARHPHQKRRNLHRSLRLRRIVAIASPCGEQFRVRRGEFGVENVVKFS